MQQYSTLLSSNTRVAALHRTLALAQAVLAGLHQSLRLGRERIAHLERKYASQARHRKSAEG